MSAESAVKLGFADAVGLHVPFKSSSSSSSSSSSISSSSISSSSIGSGSIGSGGGRDGDGGVYSDSLK